MTERESLQRLLEDMLEEAKTRVETLQALKRQLEDGTGEGTLVEGWAKRLEEPTDLDGMPDEKLRELQDSLDDGLEELEDEEDRLACSMKSIFSSRDTRGATPVRAPSGPSANSGGGAGGAGGDSAGSLPSEDGFRAPSGPSPDTRDGAGGAGGDSAGSLSAEDELADLTCLLGRERDYRLAWDRRFVGRQVGPRDEGVRARCREGTKKKVAQELGLKHFGDSAWRAKRVPECSLGVHVFLDRTPAARVGEAPAGGPYLLGRYDVVVAKVGADLDSKWDFIQGAKPEFWVAHATALNIGESSRASDFPDCSCQNTEGGAARRLLDEEFYLQAMEHILSNVCRACRTLHVEHIVFFPFGMGAFMRHLGQLDSTFARLEKMQNLRRRLARNFMRVFARATPASTHVHICLGFSAEEASCNADAFLRALLAHSAASEDVEHLEALARRVTIYPEGDSLHLAHELAGASAASGPPKVLLVNGANRKLLGNHWFAGHALRAIDENLHRRSWKMAATSYLLNGFGVRTHRERGPGDLEENAKWLRGNVHFIEDMGEQL